MHDQNLDERPWYLATKFLSGGLNPEEHTEWESLLKNDPGFRQEFDQVRSYWEKAGQIPLQQIDPEQDWKRVWEKIRKGERSGRSFMLTPWLRYAAVIALCVCFAFLLWRSGGHFFAPANKVVTTIEAPIGSKSYVTLPDSSKVWLNAGSKVSWNSGFGVDNRHLTLEGEAFFDVVKKKVPFIIATEPYDITVLGTAFNVKAYRNDERFSVTLVRGSLKVSDIHLPTGTKEALLEPNEKLVFRKNAPSGEQLSIEKHIDTSLETAWKDGWLAVQSESLGELAVTLERMYDIRISFQEEELRDYRYTGKIRQLSLEQVLKALALTSPIEFDIREKDVTIRENKATKSKYRNLQSP